MLSIGVMATVFCISVVNIDYFEDSYKILLTIITYFSAGILLISTLMLHRLPQAVESLAFKVGNISDYFQSYYI